ncbi:MAG: hypothetical protein HGA31_06385 [Candidatus Moranbacteria bacterium]|nr:hypothetical protein [Candidatus Moranbacteria bacterium]
MNRTSSSLVALAVSVICGTILLSGKADAFPLLENLKAKVKDTVKIQEDAQKGLNLQSIDRTTGIGANLQEKFCSGFADAIANMNGRIDEAQKKLQDRRDTREESWSSRWENQDAKLGQLRTEQDARREEWYAKLDSTDLTDAQESALKKFRGTVDAAVDDRRESVDSANEAFREAVGKLSISRQSAIDGIASDFQSSVDAAFAAAKKACDNGKDAKTVRSEFRDAIEAARTAMKKNRDKQSGIGDQVSALAKTRNEVIRKAVDTFKSRLDVASAELKKSFPSTATVTQ